ncbi:MAG: hypothetical protein Q7R30_03065 [Acidobacteriota bacterium]|nr:hypothetical protein [Acidobacteriota bacterium]
MVTSKEVDDVTPPIVTLKSPADGITTRKAEITVKGRVSDTESGIASVTCNGQPATVVDGVVRCVVSLRPGVNDVILQASDVAGNSASAGARVTLARRTISAIALTPGRKTMLVNQGATLSLRDDAGVEVSDALWTSSDSGTVTLSTDDPPILTAIRPGSATITAEIDGLSAEATIAVVAGTELPAGTTRWSVPLTPGLTMERLIFTNRVDESGPDLFIVETETWGEATLRAVDAEGSVLWQQHSPGIPLMGDSFGGVIAGVLYDVNQGDDLQAYVRLGNAGGVPPWRYQSPGILLRPAQAPDGTLYAIEFLYGGVDASGDDILDKHAIVIDGATGRLISRAPLAREILAFESAKNGVVLTPKLTCRSTRAEFAPQTVGPIVGSDGRGYMLVRRRIRLGKGSCNEFNGANYVPARTQDIGVDLIALSPTNAPVTQSLYALQCTSAELQRTSCDVPPSVSQLLPDGTGGLLASWRRTLRQVNSYSGQSYVTRIDAAGARVDTPVTQAFWIDLIGQAGTAYVRSPGGYRLVDMTSFATKGTLSLPGLGLVATRPDGGVATIDYAGVLHVLGPTGEEEEVTPLGLSLTSAVQEFDGWIGLSDAGLTSVAGQFQDATRWVVIVGNRSGQLAVRRPGMGIFLKSQDAVIPFLIAQHNSIRIVPYAQDWLASQPSLQPPQGLDATDGFGNRYFTLGAGLPSGVDTELSCGGGNLTKGINREGDVIKPVKALRKLPVGDVSEGATIFSLLAHFNNYGDDVPYWCLPGDPDSTAGLAYNSNSFAHGLLHAAGVPHDERAPRWPAPGWDLPVPAKHFKHTKKPEKVRGKR